MNIVTTLSTMPKNSIYALINEQGKEIYLTYAYDVLLNLTRLLSEIRAGFGLPIDPSQFNYKLLETTDRSLLKLRFNYWYDNYNELGYKFLNKRKPVNYRLLSSFGIDFRNGNKKLLYVKLKNRSNEIILGAFDNIEECDNFLNNYGGIYHITYATNQLTKEFLNGY